MAKSLQDYKQEIEPKTEVQSIQEFKNKKYRAIDAFYIGLVCIILLVVLKFSNINFFGIKLDTVTDYIELRKKLIWFSLIERVIWVYVITLFANKLNRQPLGWQIFAFFTPYLSLIVIGLTPKIDNNFYEYQSSSNKEQFFSSLSLTEKLKLYKHLLNRAKISPHWFDKLLKCNAELFSDEQTSLETLQHYEKMYNKNLLTVIKSNLPYSISDRQEYLKSLEQVGITD